jgi:hypothetical protein
MEATQGNQKIKIGLIDGQVDLDHQDFSGVRIRNLVDRSGSNCSSIARIRATFIAGMLASKNRKKAIGICPQCELLVYNIFCDGNYKVSSVEELSTALG